MDDPLALSPEAMRATGYRMVDLLVEHVAGVRDRPALTRGSPAEMRERLHGPAPEAGADFEAMLATLERDEVNFSDLGVQLTRSARAFKVWMSVTLFGAAAFRAAIDASLDLALLAEARVREHPEPTCASPS